MIKNDGYYEKNKRLRKNTNNKKIKSYKRTTKKSKMANKTQRKKSV